ncbi:hypothetical protein GOA75_08575 [Sinorhizobium meliloti]|nr:hypothetical protein [Sinorhizobium meliloti]
MAATKAARPMSDSIDAVFARRSTVTLAFGFSTVPAQWLQVISDMLRLYMETPLLHETATACIFQRCQGQGSARISFSDAAARSPASQRRCRPSLHARASWPAFIQPRQWRDHPSAANGFDLGAVSQPGSDGRCFIRQRNRQTSRRLPARLTAELRRPAAT